MKCVTVQTPEIQVQKFGEALPKTIKCRVNAWNVNNFTEILLKK